MIRRHRKNSQKRLMVIILVIITLLTYVEYSNTNGYKIKEAHKRLLKLKPAEAGIETIFYRIEYSDTFIGIAKETSTEIEKTWGVKIPWETFYWLNFEANEFSYSAETDVLIAGESIKIVRLFDAGIYYNK